MTLDVVAILDTDDRACTIQMQVSGLSEDDQQSGGDPASRDFWLKFEIEDTGIGMYLPGFRFDLSFLK